VVNHYDGHLNTGLTDAEKADLGGIPQIVMSQDNSCNAVAKINATVPQPIYTKAPAQYICTTGESSKPRECEASDHAARPSEAAFSHARH
jgi:hypothetical protein